MLLHSLNCSSWVSFLWFTQLNSYRTIVLVGNFCTIEHSQIQRRRTTWWKVYKCLDSFWDIGELFSKLFVANLKPTKHPGWCGSVDWVPACKPKGRWFDSQSGHMPGLWARSPVGGAREETTHWCFSPLILLPLPSLKINK